MVGRFRPLGMEWTYYEIQDSCLETNIL